MERNHGQNDMQTDTSPYTMQSLMATQATAGINDENQRTATGQEEQHSLLVQAVESDGQAVREQVVAVRKNGDGDIVELQLTSGRVVDYKTAQTMVKNDEIANMNVFRGRDGDEHLRSDPDGREDNNLDNLPLF